MKAFRRIAFLATITTYFLIFVGGLVRVSGAGLGCPDWPKCYGRWFPPLSVADLPFDINPTGLTVVLAWIEYINRLIGVSVGFLILTVAILALIKFRNAARILYPSLIAAVLVAYQGWQGGRVVTSELEPFLVSLHLLISYIIVSLLIYVVQQTYYLRQADVSGPVAKYPRQAVLWMGLLWLGGMLQILLGTQVREEIEIVARTFPLLSDMQWIARVGFWNDLHMISGMLVVLFTWFVGFTILRMSEHASPLVRQSLWAMMILMLFEVVIGLSFYVTGLAPVMQLFHQWVAGLFIGLALVAFFGLRYHGAEAVAYGRSFRQVVVPVAAGVAAMAVVAFLVVGRAEAERSNLPVLGTIPAFEFVERQGEPFGLDELRGKVNVVEFFFTSCRGPCPTMNANLSELYREFAHSDEVRLVSLTVDPETDSLPVLREYATHFGVTDNRWVFVRGEADQISWLAEEGFHVSGELPGMHSTKFILVDQQGRIRGYYDYDSEISLKQLREHIAVLAREAA